MSTQILVHLSEYLCETFHFDWCDLSDFKNLYIKVRSGDV